MVRAYFDVGNVVIYAYLRIGFGRSRSHCQDPPQDFNFDRANGRFTWKNLGEGERWPELRRALQDVGYAGYGRPSSPVATRAYLRTLMRVDRFLAGQKPVG